MFTGLLDHLPDHSKLKLERIFRGLECRDDSPDGMSRGRGGVFRLSLPDTPVHRVPELVRFTLVGVLGCKALGTHEKRAWEIPLRFEGVDVAVALEKFGLRFYVDAESVREDEARVLAERLLRSVQSAVPIIEKHILGDVVTEQVAKSHVTIAALGPRLWAQYEHFRDRARQEAQRSRPGRLVMPGRLPMEAEFDVVATVTALLSYLEHLCVIELAFTDFDPSSESLTAFIASRWFDKLSRVVDLADDEVKRRYDALHRVVAEHRNPWLHGGFDRDHGQIYIHLDGFSALPVRLSAHANGPTYQFAGSQPGDQTVWDVLTDLEDWLDRGALRFAHRLAQSGLDVPFDPGTRLELREASTSDADFEQLLDAWSRYDSIVTNMDW